MITLIVRNIVSQAITWDDIWHSIIASLWLKAQMAPPYYSSAGLSKRLKVAGEMGKVTGEIFKF